MVFITKDEIYSLAIDVGFDDCGFVETGEISGIFREHFDTWLKNGYNAKMQWIERNIDIRFNPKLLQEDAKCAVVVLLKNENKIENLSSQKIARFALGGDYHKKIRAKLRIIAEKIGGNTRICVDSAPILEKYWATKAGLGFIGRNTLFISPKLGSFCNIGILLSNADICGENEQFLPQVKQKKTNYCENCNKCINSCPTKAFPAPYMLDCNKCISYRNQYESEPDFNCFGWEKGCDICQEVCPFNNFRRIINSPNIIFSEKF